MRLTKHLRLISSCFIGILFLTGCLSSSAPDPVLPSPEQIKNLRNPSGDYFAAGKVLFIYPDGKHSGELALKLTSADELKLQIFAPLVGSLIYEFKVSKDQFLVLNYQDNNYVLEKNISVVRQTLLGMDISIEELRWILKGKLPNEMPKWKIRQLPTGETQLLQGDVEVRLRFNEKGYLQSLSKTLAGLLEYRAVIPLYKPRYGIPFPRKIKITDQTEQNHWTMVISDVKPPPLKRKRLDFLVPEGLEEISIIR